MKKTLLIIFLIVGLILVIKYVSDDKLSKTLFSGPCNKAVTYRIGNISPIYDLDEAELKNMLHDIDTAWSNTVGKDLFEYAEDGSISINLIYDEQQRFLNKEQSASLRIKLEKTSYRTAEKKLLKLRKQYDNSKEEYEQLVAQYNRAGNDGAYGINKDKQEQKIRQKQDALNRLGTTINIHVSKLNRISEQIDDLIADYNNTYGSQQEFHQGNYQKTADRETINIFSYHTLDELRLVLAHEMGHALGLDHVQNSQSVMFYLMKNKKKGSIDFTKEDITALNDKCGD